MGRKTNGTLTQRGNRETYYLRYMAQGIARRVRLLTPDGKPIHGTGPDGKPLSRAAAAEARKAAEAAADIYLAHIRISDKAERLRVLQNDLRDAETAAGEAEADTLNARATIADGWELFMACPKRPASCKRYKAGDTLPRDTTPYNYRSFYGRFAAWIKAHHRKTRLLSEVSPELAAAFMDTIAGMSSAGTHGKYLTFFRCLYDVLADAGKITIQQNPFADIDSIEGETHSKRPLTRQQISALLDTAAGELQALIALGYFTGLRFGDCCCLRWDETDLGRGIIERVPSKTKNTVKDKDKARVKIGIPPYLAALLAALPRAGAYVLPDAAAKYLGDRRDVIHGEIRRLFERCGIETRAQGTGAAYHYEGKRKVYEKGRPRAVVQYGFHSLRYSYISHNAEAGTPAAIIQRNAGHSNPAMTEHYTRISDAAAVKYAAALDMPAAPAARDMVIDATPAAKPPTVRREGKHDPQGPLPDFILGAPGIAGARAQLRRIIDTMTEEQAAGLLESMKGARNNG
ncbi:tyrosine-type recombinase/integrase [Oligosphaera ethanolica]|uniref:Integrase n=1 Tax=Oligosphaera ethanolica TaxID=760260 RepID=A0AAE3VI09_9BACT|nr:site-specific integrase [Oligosphaera ethanolica]MDQ0290646.1 integrase [Oligosphaera ethanolica]